MSRCAERDLAAWSRTTGPPVEARRALLDVFALEYDAAADGPLELVTAYRARDGTLHKVAINLHADVDWRVIDIDAAGVAILVERLAGWDDRRGQALALARDYVTQCRAHARGLRADPPLLSTAQRLMRWCSDHTPHLTTGALTPPAANSEAA